MTVIFLLCAIVLAVFYFWYAAIISRNNKALEALAGIDVQFRQRLDLIPNILKIAKKFMEHERSLIEDITVLRTQVDKKCDPASKESLGQHLAMTEQLTSKMGQLMVSVENYPTLKSDQTMIQAMQTYNEVEAQIAAARRFYNAAVADLNNAIQIFPGSAIAGLVNVTAMPFYKAEAAAAAPIDAESILG